MFGRAQYRPCNEETNFRPDNPYAVSKLFAHMTALGYRESYSLFAVNGILFNHESPLRPPHFVSRKISSAVARISQGATEKLKLGNLHAVRDWGYAGDYVRGMWLSLQVDEPSDYVFCTGKAHSVEDFVRVAFEVVGLDWRDHVVQAESLQRASEPAALIGNSSKARRELGWRPLTSFQELPELMVRCDLKATQDSDGNGI